jgi:hypothetical protein
MDQHHEVQERVAILRLEETLVRIAGFLGDCRFGTGDHSDSTRSQIVGLESIESSCQPFAWSPVN